MMQCSKNAEDIVVAAKVAVDTAENELRKDPAKWTIQKVPAGDTSLQVLAIRDQEFGEDLAFTGASCAASCAWLGPPRFREVKRQTLQGSFSSVSKPNFVNKYALELGSV